MIYNGFAQIYDNFMDVSYDEWADYIQGIWRHFGISPNLVLDLACGTGSLTSILSKRGYDMIGVDISEEMLAIARRKDPDILFLQQDMRKFELYGTVDAIICACDAINYLTENGDLEQVFKLAANYLNPGGLFIFDINTEYKFKEILADNTFAAADDTAAYIWENFYDDNDKINEYSITCFAKDGEVYNRFDELHMQRAYSVNEIKAALAAANLEFLAHYHEMTQEEPEAKAERVFFVAKSKK